MDIDIFEKLALNSFLNRKNPTFYSFVQESPCNTFFNLSSIIVVN